MHGYGPVADIILCHHERMDGAGYPRSLAGDDIPLLARILSVCDTFDVMTATSSASCACAGRRCRRARLRRSISAWRRRASAGRRAA